MEPRPRGRSSWARRVCSRWKLRRCASVGPGALAYGRVWVHGRGDVQIASGAVLDGRSAPIELNAHSGATIRIGCGAFVEGGASIEAQEDVTVGPGARIGRLVKVLDSHFHTLRRDGSQPPPPLAVVIGPGAVVEEGAVVLRGGQIEPGAHVLAGAVVSRRVPAGARFPSGPGPEGKEPRPPTAGTTARTWGPARGVSSSRVAALVAMLTWGLGANVWYSLLCYLTVLIVTIGLVRAVAEGGVPETTELLEQQFDNPVTGQNRILQVSEGFTYTWSQIAAKGSKVDIASIKINGVPIDPNATYRVTVNSFLADGGDGFSVLTQGTDRLGGAVDTDALEAYFVANSPVAPGPQNRITVAP